MPPSMLSSEALVIWMFRIAMNEPIMAAITAIQTVTLARSDAELLDTACEVGSADVEADGLRLDMARCSLNRIRYLGCRRLADRRLGVRLDGRNHRHARPQLDERSVAAVERDLHGNALHHLGEVAGGVIRRQQCEFLAAGGCDAVDMAVHDL